MRNLLLISFLFLSTHIFGQDNFKVPAFEKYKLKNGITVYLMEQHEIPLVNVNMVFNAGSIHDGTQFGLSSTTADGLLLGTSKYTKSDIEEKTDFLGAQLNTYSSKDKAGLAATFAKKDQAVLFDIIQQVVMHPNFENSEYEKSKKRNILQLTQQKESPRAVISNYFDSFVYSDFPYAHPTNGTPQTIEKITREQLIEFYQTNYTTEQAAIAIVGDFKIGDMKKTVAQLFDNWKTKPARMIKRKAPEMDFDQSRVLLVNKEDATETTFLIGGKGIPYNSEDYVSIMVANTILGDRFTSWLNDALRVNSGLTYGAGSRFIRNQFAGTFYISTFTKNQTTVQAIDMALNVLDSLHQTGPNEQILASAKAYVKGDFPPNYESASSLALLLTDMHIYKFDENFINLFQKKVEQIDLPQIKAVIKKYFPQNKLQFVVIGKTEEIEDQLTKYGTITKKEIKSDGF